MKNKPRWAYTLHLLYAEVVRHEISLDDGVQEVDKVSLAEMTGLDQKQINNWFINQRKRHWKPSENMHLAMMENLSGHLFMNGE